jgi:hypothetical protein
MSADDNSVEKNSATPQDDNAASTGLGRGAFSASRDDSLLCPRDGRALPRCAQSFGSVFLGR